MPPRRFAGKRRKRKVKDQVPRSVPTSASASSSVDSVDRAVATTTLAVIPKCEALSTSENNCSHLPKRAKRAPQTARCKPITDTYYAETPKHSFPTDWIYPRSFQESRVAREALHLVLVKELLNLTVSYLTQCNGEFGPMTTTRASIPDLEITEDVEDLLVGLGDGVKMKHELKSLGITGTHLRHDTGCCATRDHWHSLPKRPTFRVFQGGDGAPFRTVKAEWGDTLVVPHPQSPHLMTTDGTNLGVHKNKQLTFIFRAPGSGDSEISDCYEISPGRYIARVKDPKQLCHIIHSITLKPDGSVASQQLHEWGHHTNAWSESSNRAIKNGPVFVRRWNGGLLFVSETGTVKFMRFHKTIYETRCMEMPLDPADPTNQDALLGACVWHDMLYLLKQPEYDDSKSKDTRPLGRIVSFVLGAFKP